MMIRNVECWADLRDDGFRREQGFEVVGGFVGFIVPPCSISTIDTRQYNHSSSVDLSMTTKRMFSPPCNEEEGNIRDDGDEHEGRREWHSGRVGPEPSTGFRPLVGNMAV